METPTEIRGRAYINEIIAVDGIDFIDCTFANCFLVYSGGMPFTVDANAIVGSTLEFEGPAANTLNLLRAMHEGGHAGFVERIVDQLRSGSTERAN